MNKMNISGGTKFYSRFMIVTDHNIFPLKDRRVAFGHPRHRLATPVSQGGRTTAEAALWHRIYAGTLLAGEQLQSLLGGP